LNQIPTVAELWHTADVLEWHRALERYWSLVKPANLALERELNSLQLASLRSLGPTEWYDFLHEKYFRWKYTAANRLATTRASLRSYMEENALEALDRIRQRLLALNLEDIRTALAIATTIRGLGTAGASGLLALMYPHAFATVDQFVVRALSEVGDPSITSAVSSMKPEALKPEDGIVLVRILRRKAQENNGTFGSTDWTPRKIEMILWTYGSSAAPERPRRARHPKPHGL